MATEMELKVGSRVRLKASLWSPREEVTREGNVVRLRSGRVSCDGTGDLFVDVLWDGDGSETVGYLPVRLELIDAAEEV